MAECRIEQHGAVLVAYLSGEIDHHAAGRLREQLDARILSSPVERVVLDFGSVGFMDSSGIGLILGRYRLLQEIGGVLAVQGVGSQVARMLQLSGLSGIITSEGGARV